MPKFYTLEDMTQKDLNKLALERNIFASEIENLKKENKKLEEIINIKECQLEEIQQNKTDYTQVNILEMKIDRLNNIIKEVRKEMENSKHISIDDSKAIIEHERKILKILDGMKGD